MLTQGANCNHCSISLFIVIYYSETMSVNYTVILLLALFYFSKSTLMFIKYSLIFA